MTQATDLGVLVSRCFLDHKNGGPAKDSGNVGCSFFKYTNNVLSNLSHQTL